MERRASIRRIWPSNRWLEFYARYFPAVEIDSTFYSAPVGNSRAALGGNDTGALSVSPANCRVKSPINGGCAIAARS